jgi:hypothetical protein
VPHTQLVLYLRYALKNKTAFHDVNNITFVGKIGDGAFAPV